MSPFRIAFDVRPGNSGPARYVASLVRALSGPQWEVSFLDPQPSILENCRVPRERTDNAVAAAPGQHPLTSLVPHSARLWLGFQRKARQLAGRIRQVPLDLLHSQHTGCEEMPVAARQAGVPRVLGTFHVDSTYDLDRSRSSWTYRLMEWYSNRSLHLAIAVSEATRRDWIARSGIPSESVVTIHNGIDPEHFRRRQSREVARRQLALPEDALILGGLGRLDPAKGFADLIDSLAALRQEFPRACVAIGGVGRLRSELEARAAARGVADRVMFLGQQSDVNLFLDACDVFVMPSLCETLGYALLEAMAHELPAVGTSVGGIPEVIVPGETGFLAPARDPAALAASIRNLLSCQALRQRLGRAGRKRVIEHFHERDMVEKTLDVYQRLLAHRLSARDATNTSGKAVAVT